MLRSYLGARSRSHPVVNGISNYVVYLRGSRPYTARKAIHNQLPPHLGAGSSYSSHPSDNLQFPNSFVQLVEFIRSVGKARKIMANKDGTNPESNKTKKKKKKKKTQGKEDKSEKQRNEGEPNEGNEHIVAALVDAINKDYWPDIIYYSTLHPQHLQWWHPEESEWLAGHRMSMALSELPEWKLDSICDRHGGLSVEKLAKIWAKKRLDQVDYIPGVDYDEDLLAADIPWPAGPNKPKEPWTFELNGLTLRVEPKNKESDGPNESVQSDDSDKPGS